MLTPLTNSKLDNFKGETKIWQKVQGKSEKSAALLYLMIQFRQKNYL